VSQSFIYSPDHFLLLCNLSCIRITCTLLYLSRRIMDPKYSFELRIGSPRSGAEGLHMTMS
jgi:hypothetical protein